MSSKDKPEDNSDEEDIPSDFFDDFNKAEFIEGLSVIDSWDDDGGMKSASSRSRIDLETVDSVKDLRELIGDGKQDRKDTNERDRDTGKYTNRKRSSERAKRSRSQDLDRFIRPGSRRDPTKTNEAIKKDKDLKVKEFLAKSLESSDDIRPPGTELDGFYEEGAKVNVRMPVTLEVQRHRSRSPKERPRSRTSKERPRRESPRRIIQRRQRESPQRRARESPLHRRNSPMRRRDYSPRRFSPHRSRRQFSPLRRGSPGRRSPRRGRRSRSPLHCSPDRRTPSDHRDSFLYPSNSSIHYETHPSQAYPTSGPHWETNPMPNEYSMPYSYPNMTATQPGPAYSGYAGPYDYGAHSAMQGVPAPAPAPYAPVYIPAAAAPQPVPAPLPVPAPALGSSASTVAISSNQLVDSNKKTPYDALAQLVADGKISKEDYLKLTPNKGSIGPTPMELKEKVDLLGRCHNAVTKLTHLHLPNKLVMHNNIVGQEPKVLAPKYCSPLKRQVAVDFQFTRKAGTSTAQQNKQLIESIISTIGLDKVVSRPKKDPKDMKDAACQTMRPYCDVCEIRDSIKVADGGTYIDPDYFSASVHTQVVDQDLINSKAVFTPGGGVSDGATMSIAHMTPAQLVSQLAARAKTLKQTDPEPPNNHQYMRRNPNTYDRGGNQYHNYGNYRY